LIEKEEILGIKDTENLMIATEECAQKDEHLEVGTTAVTAPSQDERIQQEIQKRSLFDIWMEFVYSERIQEGMYNNLVETNKKGCECGKGRMSSLIGHRRASMKQKRYLTIVWIKKIHIENTSLEAGGRLLPGSQQSGLGNNRSNKKSTSRRSEKSGKDVIFD
jgi:hypothetical protein